jgi:hypothetical protein
MRFLDPDGPIRRLTILKHEKITKKWLMALEIGAFPEGRPEIKGATHGFLSAIVEVVAERRAYLRFCLYRGDQCLFPNDQKIPFLCRSEETRKVNGLFSKGIPFGYSSPSDEFREKINKTVHLGAAGYCAAQSMVGPATFLLLVPLGGPAFPIMSNGLPCFFR